MPSCYYLYNKKPMPCITKEDYEKLEELLCSEKKWVAQDFIENYFISTVFLGVNHNRGSGEPLVFETMIFDQIDEHNKTAIIEDYIKRYSTWEEAEEGHKGAVEWVKNKLKEGNND